jgi:hypothetical protein
MHGGHPLHVKRFLFPFMGVFIGFVCRDSDFFISLVYVAGFVVSEPIRSFV